MESVRKSARLNSDLTEDLWPEILARLPVKSICRFRSVCKSWNSLIPSSFFVNHHSSINRNPPHHYNIRLDVRFPFRFLCAEMEDLYSVKIVDCIRGLVCVSYTMDSSYDSTILWNPGNHKYVSLPRLPFPSHIESPVSESECDHVEQSARFYCNAVGFGYDASSDDFKVVRIWMWRKPVVSSCGFIPTTYEVYSARQGLWRMAKLGNNNNSLELSSYMFDISTSRTGCFLNGRIHWLVTTHDLWMDSVLVFDCASEEFVAVLPFPREVQEPNAMWADPSLNPVRKAEVLEYGGMLSLLLHRHWEDRIELWALDQPGSTTTTTTWNKLFTLESDSDVMSLYQPSCLNVVAPHGPKQWIRFPAYVDRFRQVFAYQESMILMDHPNAKSYTNTDTVNIIVPAHPKFWHLLEDC